MIPDHTDHLNNFSELVTGPTQDRESSQCGGITSYCFNTVIEAGIDVVKFFPTPVALDATLRLLSDKVSGVFSEVLPFAFPLWTLASFTFIAEVIQAVSVSNFLSQLPIPHVELIRDRLQHFIGWKVTCAIAIIANTILWAAGTNIAFLCHTTALIGRLSFWCRSLLLLRDIVFLINFKQCSEQYSSTLRVLLQQILSFGVFVFSYSGYTTTIGIMATCAASLGAFHHFYPD
jgi:hypothetical protein